MNNEEKILELLTEMKQEICGVKQETLGMKQEISGMKQEISGIKQEISGMKQEISGMKQEISGIKQEISGMKQEISGIKQEISGIKQEISGMKQEISSINNRLDHVEGQLQENTAILRAIEHRVEEDGAKIEGLSVEMAKGFEAVRSETSKRFGGLEEDIKGIFEIIKDVPPMKEMIMEHECTLRRMRVR